MSNQEILNKLQDTIVHLEINGGVAATQEALDAGISAIDIIEGFSESMGIVGDKFEAGECVGTAITFVQDEPPFIY